MAGRLTVEESRVLSLCAQGLTSKEIAGRHGISKHTVDEHVANAVRKLSARNRTEAVAQAMAEGLIDAER